MPDEVLPAALAPPLAISAITAKAPERKAPEDEDHPDGTAARAALGRLIPTDSGLDVFLAWEQLRISYNVILAFLALGLAFAWGRLWTPEFWSVALLGALRANLYFCAGPCLEGYIAYLGGHRLVARTLFFLVGVGWSCVLAVGALFPPVSPE
jgi:hypothetical protein